ncbi:type II secretion system F family protein [Chitinimonas lacunae]|uniref:Type II secretion system F family protein n=1 Tax=Chitinimonas lacunae TaxID=1963018 RepID=A0ABV8MPL5_9NEIS
MEFVYEAIDSNGRLRCGRIDATDPLAAERGLVRAGFEPLRLRPHLERRRPPSRHERAALWRELAQLLGAGIALADALADLGRDAESPALRGLARRLAEAVEGGIPLSEALARQGTDPVAVGLVRAGERSGRLLEVLGELAESAQQELTEAQRLRQALLYPTVVALLGAAVTVFILLYLVPALGGFIDAIRRPPTWSLRCLLTASTVLREHWGLLLAGPPLLITLGLPLWRRFGTRCWSWLPLVGTAWTHLLRARLARQFGLLYGAGLTVPDSLALLDALLPDRNWRRRLAACRAAVVAGRGIADGCAEAELFAPAALRMLRVGERSGRLEAALAYVARYHGEQGSVGFARLRQLAEPLLTVALGGLLGLLMMAVLGPVYDSIGQLR